MTAGAGWRSPYFHAAATLGLERLWAEMDQSYVVDPEDRSPRWWFARPGVVLRGGDGKRFVELAAGWLLPIAGQGEVGWPIVPIVQVGVVIALPSRP